MIRISARAWLACLCLASMAYAVWGQTSQPQSGLVKIAMVGDVMLADGPGKLIRSGQDPFRHVAAAHAAGMPAIIANNERGQRRELSWPELRRQAAALSLHLKAQGVKPGDRIGTLAPGRNADLVVWSANPFSIYAKADLVLIDGAVAYDRAAPPRARSAPRARGRSRSAR